MVKYSRAITRQHRSAYVILLDLSGSMQDVVEYEGNFRSKGECMVDVANKILQELHLRAYRDGEMRNYYDVAVIGYSGRGVVSLLPSEQMLVPITELCSDGKRLASIKCLTPLNDPNDNCGSEIVVEAEGSTPMCEVLCISHELLREWCDREENYDSAPPMLFHITDGHVTDGDLNDIVDVSKRVKSLSTNDGNILMFNIHLGSNNHYKPMLFPTDREIAEHPNAFFRAMGYSSSVLPTSFVPLIHEVRGERSSEGYRGVGFNLSVLDVITMMNIGTLTVSVG